MSIGKIRSALYFIARILGDVNAINRDTIPQRIVRRGLGYGFGRIIGKIVGVIFGRTP